MCMSMQHMVGLHLLLQNTQWRTLAPTALGCGARLAQDCQREGTTKFHLCKHECHLSHHSRKIWRSGLLQPSGLTSEVGANHLHRVEQQGAGNFLGAPFSPLGLSLSALFLLDHRDHEESQEHRYLAKLTAAAAAAVVEDLRICQSRH